MSWYQEAMLMNRPGTDGASGGPAPRPSMYDRVEAAIRWLFVAGWAMTIIARVGL